MIKMVDSISKKVRVVKYKTGEIDFKNTVDLKAMLQKLKPKHDEIIEIVIRKV